MQVLPLPALRRTIAATMVRAIRSAVLVTTTDEADITELVALRQRVATAAPERGSRITLLPFLLKSPVQALRRHPQLNAEIDENLRHLRLKRYYNIGIATDTSDGLIVPVLRNVDNMSVAEIASGLELLTSHARQRSLSVQDVKGGTFTISNFGAIGGIFATPVLQPPQVAILGFGKATPKPVVRDGGVVVRTLLPLSLTFDHRALDGATVQRFLNEFASLCARPEQLDPQCCPPLGDE